ncbi:MAG: MMPL family transporter [Pseudomonadota bacterium]
MTSPHDAGAPAPIKPVTRPARAWWAISIWLGALLLGIILVSRASFTADLSAFLPSSPTQEQQLLVEQLRDGMVSRLILVGIEGADAPARAALSKAVAQELRNNKAFLSVNNGEPISEGKDRAYLFNNRYLLSRAVTPERFTEAGLRTALNDTLDLLASPAGLLVKETLAQDPTGEMAELLGQFNSARQPRKLEGVWAAKDGTRALMLLQTRAIGSDTDGQEQAIAEIRKIFESSKAALVPAMPQLAATSMVMSGPGVFSVNARATIADEVTRISIISAVAIMLLLFVVYRSGVALVLGLLPVLSGVLAGVVAVSLGFGVVHGITLGFGTTLIGESIDYSIYLFIQSKSSDQSGDWVKKFWPTIRLGMLTSIVGFASLLFSGFPGLAQLGLYSIAGLVVAACVTRFVLPSLLPANFAVRDLTHIGLRVDSVFQHLQRLRIVVLLLVAASCVFLWVKRDQLWHPELNALSPVSVADQRLDETLRRDIGAPDVRYLIVVKGSTPEEVLQGTEKVAVQLNGLIDQGALSAFESPSRYLPSEATQRMRLSSLPLSATLQERLDRATQGLPFKTGVMTPFMETIDRQAKAAADPAGLKSMLLTRASLDGTSMALATDSLLIQQPAGATGLLPLTAAAGKAIDLELIRSALEKSGVKQAYFIDLKTETDKLYRGYVQEALILSLCGLAAMLILLAFNLRSARRVLNVATPLLAAVIVVAAMLALFGQRMTILHLIGLLLTAAVGSNYALFFDQPNKEKRADDPAGQTPASHRIQPNTLASLAFANITTVLGFGLLGISSVPVLNAIGVTVGPGAILALLFAAVFSSTTYRDAKPPKSNP